MKKGGNQMDGSKINMARYMARCMAGAVKQNRLRNAKKVNDKVMFKRIKFGRATGVQGHEKSDFLVAGDKK